MEIILKQISPGDEEKKKRENIDRSFVEGRVQFNQEKRRKIILIEKQNDGESSDKRRQFSDEEKRTTKKNIDRSSTEERN